MITKLMSFFSFKNLPPLPKKQLFLVAKALEQKLATPSEDLI